MALVIEDGTGVTGANTYVSVATAKAFASSRGDAYPTVDLDVEKLLIQAVDYLEGQRRYFRGTKTDPTQPLQYPRLNSMVDGVIIADNVIPIELKYAQMQLSIDAFEFGSLLPSSDGYAVAVEKVDVLEIQYAAGGRLSGTSLPATPNFPKAQAWLDALTDNGFTAYISTQRI